MEINPYQNELTQTDEELKAELHAELANLKRRAAYITELLRTVDPEVDARERFIDEAHEGS